VTNAEEYEWVGIIYKGDVKCLSGGDSWFVLVTPLACHDEDGWYSVSEKRRRQCFPNNGKVAVFSKEWSASKNSQLYQFWPERNPRADENREDPWYAIYWAPHGLQPTTLAQVVDWTHKAPDPTVLPAILAQDLRAETCYTQTLYIQYLDHLYGPIPVDLEQHKPRPYAQSSSSGGPELLVRVYPRPPEGFLDCQDGHLHFYLLDEHTLGTPQGEEDWSLPQAVIKHILQASKEVSSATEGVQLVDKHIRKLAQLSSEDGPAALHLHPATLKRAQDIVNHQIKLLEDLQELDELIVQLPAAQARIEAAYKQAVKERSMEITQEVAAHAQQEQDRLQQLQQATQDAKACLEQLQSAIIDTEERHYQAIIELGAFEHEMRQRLEELRTEPMRILADLHLTASLLPTFNGASGQYLPGSGMQQASAPIPHASQTTEQQLPFYHGPAELWHNDSTQVEIITSREQLAAKQQWIQPARQAGIRPQDAQICAAAILAGLIPALVGPQSIPTLNATAQVITGGRIRPIPVPLTALSPLDLFGTIDPHQRHFVPAAGGLADVILWARTHPNELVLIILEGIDRVPGPPVYVPLLRQYIELRQATASTMLPVPINLFHLRALTANDPYQELAELVWPRNVLLAVTRDHDAHSLPLPTACDRWLIRLEPPRRSDVHATTASTRTQIAADLWQTWEEQIQIASKDEGSGSYQERRLREALAWLKIDNPEQVIAQVWPEQPQEG